LLVASKWRTISGNFRIALKIGIQIALTAISVLALILNGLDFRMFSKMNKGKRVIHFSFAVFGIAVVS
jgi:hypothetical protein